MLILAALLVTMTNSWGANISCWRASVVNGPGNVGMRSNVQPGDLEWQQRQLWGLGDSSGSIRGSLVTRQWGMGFGSQLSWQDGHADGQVTLNIRLFEVDPVLMTYPNMDPLASPNYPLTLGTMWIGKVSWTLQFGDPIFDGYRYYDPGSFVVTSSPDPVSIDYEGIGYVLNISTPNSKNNSFGSGLGCPILQLDLRSAVPEAKCATLPLLLGFLTLWLCKSNHSNAASER